MVGALALRRGRVDRARHSARGAVVGALALRRGRADRARHSALLPVRVPGGRHALAPASCVLTLAHLRKRTPAGICLWLAFTPTPTRRRLPVTSSPQKAIRLEESEHGLAERLLGRLALVELVLAIGPLEDVMRVATVLEVQQAQLRVSAEAQQELGARLAVLESRRRSLEHLAQPLHRGLMAQRHQRKNELRGVEPTIPTTCEQHARRAQRSHIIGGHCRCIAAVHVP